MGTWGAGNFENDDAAEYFIGLCKPLVEQIRNTVAQPALMQPDEPDSVGKPRPTIGPRAKMAKTIPRPESMAP